MKNLLFALVLLFGLRINAQGFEGIIDFTITEGTSTEKTTWYVKGDSVRVDYFYATNSMVRSCYLINTKTNNCVQLNHSAKTQEEVIMTMEQSRDVKVDTTENAKDFFNYKTRETIVKPNDADELHYWTNSGDFLFYRNALAWIAFDNVFYNYFWYLPNQTTAMPMLVTRTNASGTETGRLEVTRIEQRKLNAALFTMPADYKKR